MENKNISQIELLDGVNHLWFWRKGGKSFQCSFFNLISKADKRNRKMLAMGFPHLVEVFRLWDKAEDEEAFFQQYGMTLKNN